MMKGRMGLIGGLGTREPPLIELVEQYLADNSNLSYINIDDMVDYFQAQYFRFARMQRKVFANQVRTAYFDYCKRNSNNNAKPRMMPTRQAESENPVAPAQQSDSDVEEIEEDAPVYCPRNDILNASISSMYKSNVAAPPAPAQAALSPVQEALVAIAARREPQLQVVPPASTSTNNSDGAFPNPVSDSDDDLEIIEEVQGRNVIQKGDSIVDGTGNAGGMTTNTGTPVTSKIPSGLSVTLLSQESNGKVAFPRTDQDTAVGSTIRDKVAKIPTDNNVIASGNAGSSKSSSSTSTRNRSHAIVNIPGNPSSDQQRGTKRKTTVMQEDQTFSDQLGPKKLKKEVSVTGDTGYRLADFAGSEKVVEEVCRLLMHLKHPEVYKAIGVTAPRGFLLHGPPGVGKTLLANAIAGELQLPMLKVTGTEFVSGISGESESNIRDLFNQAATIAPCIIFIDEIDSITPKRETVQREMERRIVAQLLSCVDDLMNHEKGNQVLLIGATNRIESIDTALRRAGRFDKEICLGIPDEKSRQKILEVICRNLRLAPGFDLSLLAKLTPGYVGADLQMLVREAAVQAVNKALLDASVKNIKKPQPKAAEEISVATLPHPDPTVGCIEKTLLVTENQTIEDETKGIESVQQQQVKDTVANQIQNELPSSTPTDSIPEVQLPDSSSEPITIESEEANGAIEKEAESNSNGNEEKMDVDTETPDGSAVVLNSEDTTVSVVNGGESVNVAADAPPQVNSDSAVDCDMTDSVEDDEKAPEVINQEAPYLRWIREAAPLTTEQLDDLYLFVEDFEEALKHVQPSSKREGFATVPDTTWDDIGALADIREELEVSILGPVKYSCAYEALGLMSPAGVLLCGPPGCGKTLLAKAVAHEAGINFISVKGPELLNMYVGESERAVRQCFLRAKNSSPCVIFFDEIDALCPRRSDAPESGSGSRIVNQLLTEMDGVEGRQGVFIMAATNRPDILDPAILRPGRLDKILFVDLPSATDRYEILKTLTKNGTKPVLSDDVDLKIIANKECCDNYTGADLASLVREASIAAFKELVMDKSQNLATPDDLKVSMRHFETGLLKTKPSVSKEDRDKYAKMKDRYSSIRG